MYVCLSVCSEERGRAQMAPGGCTYGPVIISTGRSQEMHFTRSNSFLEDIHSSAVAPQSGLQAVPFPGSVWGRLKVCLCLRARTASHILHPLAWPCSPWLCWPLMTPICGLLGQKWGIKVCVVHLPALNIMEVVKTRDLLES